MTWRRVDLHLHTPASVDYQEPNVSPLQMLQQAEAKGLDIIAFTDHNSVRGYADLWREIEDLELLEYLKRLAPQEAERLAEYRRLLAKMLVLPGFEFTATFGFHILAIFPETTSVRLMEHLLLLLGVSEERFGSGEVGATTDVLRAYEILDQYGALVVGAHVNSTHGIAMQGLRFGGQTKIAYTQDPHLHALEVTDLMLNSNRRSTARFFSGIKPEYPRRMHCIQGSDAHRLERDPKRESNLGIGDRATELLLPDVSFAAVKALFQSEQFDRARPFVGQSETVQLFREARTEGNTAIQAFHENLSTKRSGVGHVLRDIVAFANADGGTIYIGASAFEKRPVVGVGDSDAAETELIRELLEQVTPAPQVTSETIVVDGKSVLGIHVHGGAEKPYVLAPGNIYVRDDAESVLANREQIVAMVRGVDSSDRDTSERARQAATPVPIREPQPPPLASVDPVELALNGQRDQDPAVAPERQSRSRANGQRPAEQALPVEMVEEGQDDPIAPTTGVEVIDRHELDGVAFFTLRDLRHQTIVHNVTRETGRRLWRYAIEQHEDRPIDPATIRWSGDFGFVKSYRPRGGERRFNLALRVDDRVRIFYGVGDEGLNEQWREVLPARAR